MPICKECKEEVVSVQVPVISILSPNFTLPRKFHINHECCPDCYLKVFGEKKEFTFLMEGYCK